MEAERCLKSRNNLISLSETNMAFTSKNLKKITEVKLLLIFSEQEGLTEWKYDKFLASQVSHMSAYAKHRALVNDTTKPFTTLCSWPHIIYGRSMVRRLSPLLRTDTWVSELLALCVVMLHLSQKY